MKEIYFIVNPKARNGYCKKVWDRVERELRFLEVPYRVFFTEYAGNGKEIADSLGRKAQGSNISIVAVGGDGTISEVINGAVKYSNVSIGFIPGGSGNDFSRGYDIPKKPLEALKVLLEQHEKNLVYTDVGKYTSKDGEESYFINNMGAGFDALISREADLSPFKGILNRFSLGSLVYAYILVKKLFTYRCTSIALTVDGKRHRFENTWFVTVSNQPYFGGGMKIAPEASSQDGLLDVTVVHHLSKLKLLLVFITVFWGGHKNFKEITSFKGKSISIQSSEPIYMHADGESIGTTPSEIQVIPQALSILKREM